MGWALSRQSSVLGAEWAWPWMDSCWGQGRWIGSRGFPLWFLQLRAAGQLRAQGTAPQPFVRFLNCTLQCIQAHTQLEPALGPVLQPMVWVSCSFCSPLLPGDPALASWTWASAGH